MGQDEGLTIISSYPVSDTIRELTGSPNHGLCKSRQKLGAPAFWLQQRPPVVVRMFLGRLVEYPRRACHSFRPRPLQPAGTCQLPPAAAQLPALASVPILQCKPNRSIGVVVKRFLKKVYKVLPIAVLKSSKWRVKVPF